MAFNENMMREERLRALHLRDEENRARETRTNRGTNRTASNGAQPVASTTTNSKGAT